MCRFIELSQDKVACVDDLDYEYIKQWRWHAYYDGYNWYACRNSPRGKSKRYKIHMHRVIQGLNYDDGKTTDHINRNGLDNRRSNLRVVCNKANSRNHRGHKDNTSGHNGVGWDKHSQKWQARITANYQQIHLGHFSNIEDAVKARMLGEIEYWGGTRK